MRRFLAVLLPVFGFLGAPDLSQSAANRFSSSAIPQDGTCSVNDDDIEYLVFWDGYNSIDDFVAKLGTTGDGTTRQLGFGAIIPVWVPDESYIVQAIKQAFDTARRTNVAVHFNVDDHIGWDKRPDLWNWYDPAKRGYNPDNRKNVEWYDWEGTANKRRYLTPELIPSQAPHMCYNSPALEKEIARIVSQVVGPTLRAEIEKLKLEKREYLFAGLTVGSEAGFDDYSKIPELNLNQIPRSGDPLQMQVAKLLRQVIPMMNEDKAPHSRLGYCSLTNAGYSKNNPPADFTRRLRTLTKNLSNFGTNNSLTPEYPAREFTPMSPLQRCRTTATMLLYVLFSILMPGPDGRLIQLAHWRTDFNRSMPSSQSTAIQFGEELRRTPISRIQTLLRDPVGKNILLGTTTTAQSSSASTSGYQSSRSCHFFAKALSVTRPWRRTKNS